MTTPFEYLNSINTTKDNMMRGTENDELAEKEYSPFMVNRGLSYFQDTIMFANEMNVRHGSRNKMQYEFYLNAVRPKKRFSKWHKSKKNKDVEIVMEYYGYSAKKAEQALSILSKQQLKSIKEKLEKGGT